MLLKHLVWSILFLLAGVALGQAVDGPKLNSPTAGPPPSLFAAGGSISIAALQNAAVRALTPALEATYPTRRSADATQVTIHSDWFMFTEGTAFVWVADMDVDCDGLDYKCRGNQDGQAQTDFGALAAYEVPFIVVPQRFVNKYKNVLAGNNVGAVICNGKMFYGIMGDTNGDAPQVIGEVSWLLARACFPEADLNGNKGHTEPDVTYILFTGSDSILPGSAVNENYITDFTTLRSMGDRLISSLAKNLQLVSEEESPASPAASAIDSVPAVGSSSRTRNRNILAIWPLVVLASMI